MRVNIRFELPTTLSQAGAQEAIQSALNDISWNFAWFEPGCRYQINSKQWRHPIGVIEVEE